MRFEASQHMKLGQQMKLAPRMIQSMEILQMPLAALEERIEQELESNVTLEPAEPGAEGDTAGEQAAAAAPEADESERPLALESDANAEADFERLDSFQDANPEAFENDFEAEAPRRPLESEYFDRAPAGTAGDRDAKLDAMANTQARSESLTEQLLEQWGVVDVDEELREPGRLIITNIDADGYLRTPLERILENAPADGPRPTLAGLQRALLAVQLFLEPPGIGARDPRECLLLQIDALLETTSDADGSRGGEALRHARLLIDKHIDDLVHNRIPKIAQRSGLSVEQIREAMEPMRRLTLRPGTLLVDETPRSIVPDAIVEYDEDKDEYYAYLTEGRIPNLQVNREYARLAADRATPKNDRQFIRTNLSNAQWLIDAVRQRRQTIQRVVNVVVAAQREFFDEGPQSLRPLPMTQVADQLGIHVATVSRAVAGKYVQTPRGVFPLRKFFSGGQQTESGEDMSWDAIRAAMREVVDAEDKNNPLSDEAIADAMKQRGIEIARRTVAKYRGQLNIPPARLRKQFQ